jgi:PAS domain S-box-containing protein
MREVRPENASVIRRTFYGSVVTAGAAVLLISIRDLMRQPVESSWFVLVGLTLVTGWSTLRMRDVPVSFSISDTFTIAAALLFGPAAGTVIVVIDAMVMSLRVARGNRRGMWWTRVAFNATATALAMWVAAHVFFAIARTGPLASQPGRIRDLVAPLAIFAAVYFAMNSGLVAIAVAHERRTPVAPVWREHFSALWLAYFSGASIAGVLVLMTVARVVDVKTLMLILPLLFILHVSYRAAIDRVHEQIDQLTTIASYQAALRSTGDAVIVADADGRVSLINSAAERLTGWTERGALGQLATNVFRVLDPVTRQPDDGMPRADLSGVSEYILVRPNGTECPIDEMQARVQDHRGQIIGTIRTFRDISERKAIEAEREALLERERAARASADAANRLKDEFLATISHELRTPATGILGWVRLLKTGRLDEAHVKQALGAVERSARAQALLLEDLLDMSRIVGGTLSVDLRPTDVRQALNRAIETVDPAIRSKAIVLHVEIPADVPLVRADSNRLRQVFWNLLTNAVKFTDRGGSIGVSLVREPDHLRVDVIDSGRGIDAESLPFIFDRFRQADGSSTRPYGGLGLGLAIVRNLIESHGGTVTATSEGNDRGARFTVRLPTMMSTSKSGQLDAAS